jgi:hypothetical protein
MGYDLTDEYLAEARQRAYRYQGQWTGTAGALAADVARLLIERKRMESTINDLKETNSQLRAADDAPERWKAATLASAAKYAAERLTGDSLLVASDVHPTSQAFYDLCDGLKRMHAGKSRDYGCPSGTDPLANIRNGAKFVGIPAWKAAMVRLSDKVTRLATFNATGSLHNEGVIDTLEDLASYSLLALLLYREEQGE